MPRTVHDSAYFPLLRLSGFILGFGLLGSHDNLSGASVGANSIMKHAGNLKDSSQKYIFPSTCILLRGGQDDFK